MLKKNLTYKNIKTEDFNFILIFPKRDRNIQIFTIKDVLKNIFYIERLSKTIFNIIYKKNSKYLQLVIDIGGVK